MNKDREIELFRKNKLPEYIRFLENYKKEKIKNSNLIQCYQCKQYKDISKFYLYNPKGVSLCQKCADVNYQTAIKHNKWVKHTKRGL